MQNQPVSDGQKAWNPPYLCTAFVAKLIDYVYKDVVNVLTVIADLLQG